jgi:hypothetical protein
MFAVMKLQIPRAATTVALCALAFFAIRGAVGTAATEDMRQEHGAPLEFGIDRSNMGTQWTLGWPSEPNVLRTATMRTVRRVARHGESVVGRN